MTVWFDLPEYCAGCPMMEIEHVREKNYASDRLYAWTDIFRCTHDLLCARLVEYLKGQTNAET